VTFPFPIATERARWLPVLEALVVFGLIMLHIWWLRFHAPSAWLLILGLVLLSHRWHRERAGGLGFRTAGFRRCVSEMAPALLFLAIALVAVGILCDSIRRVTFDQGFLALAGYCPWGLFQQYLLNSYFVNRFAAAWPTRYVPAISAALFSGAHLPNGFLMAVTLLAGYASARVYLKYRNLYFLGLAHAAIGFLLFLVVPDSISHHLIVGPNLLNR